MRCLRLLTSAESLLPTALLAANPSTILSGCRSTGNCWSGAPPAQQMFTITTQVDFSRADSRRKFGKYRAMQTTTVAGTSYIYLKLDPSPLPLVHVPIFQCNQIFVRSSSATGSDYCDGMQHQYGIPASFSRCRQNSVKINLTHAAMVLVLDTHADTLVS